MALLCKKGFTLLMTCMKSISKNNPMLEKKLNEYERLRRLGKMNDLTKTPLWEKRYETFKTDFIIGIEKIEAMILEDFLKLSQKIESLYGKYGRFWCVGKEFKTFLKVFNVCLNNFGRLKIYLTENDGCVIQKFSLRFHKCLCGISHHFLKIFHTISALYDKIVLTKNYFGKQISMARVTVEDCLLKVPNKFELVLLATKRSKDIQHGASPTVAKDNDKPTIIALREIAEETISIDGLKELCKRSLVEGDHYDEIRVNMHDMQADKDIEDEDVDDEDIEDEDLDTEEEFDDEEFDEDVEINMSYENEIDFDNNENSGEES